MDSHSKFEIRSILVRRTRVEHDVVNLITPLCAGSARSGRSQHWNTAPIGAINCSSPLPQPEIATMLAPSPASPESVGMSTSALARIDAHLKNRYIDSGRFPGTQLLVYRRGKVAHFSTQGLADVERNVPLR